MFTQIAIGMCKPKACLCRLRKENENEMYDVVSENVIGPEACLRGSR